MDVAEIVREPEVALYRWTADEFMALTKAGLIPEPRRVELLDGIIIRNVPPGDEHTFDDDEGGALHAVDVGGHRDLEQGEACEHSL